MTQGQLITDEFSKSQDEGIRERPLSPTLIDRIVQKLSYLKLPAKEGA